MKKQAHEAMKLIKKQDKVEDSELNDLRSENTRLAQQVEDLNLQLLQQHIAKAQDFQKSDNDSFANEVGMMEVDELAIKVNFSKFPKFS